MTGAVPSGKFWDEQESLARRRAVEIKHGRIASISVEMSPLALLSFELW